MSPAAVAIPPASHVAPVCAIHGCDKHLRRDYSRGRVTWRCPECERESARRFRLRSQNRRLRRLTSRLLACDAESVADCLTAMRRSWGGLERLLAGMPEKDRAAVMLKLSITHDELVSRSGQAAARESAAVDSAARSPAVAAAAMQVVAALPDAERIDLARRLVPAGWTVSPPG